jgi:hypothetical protein
MECRIRNTYMCCYSKCECPRIVAISNHYGVDFGEFLPPTCPLDTLGEGAAMNALVGPDSGGCRGERGAGCMDGVCGRWGGGIEKRCLNKYCSHSHTLTHKHTHTLTTTSARPQSRRGGCLVPRTSPLRPQQSPPPKHPPTDSRTTI